MKFSIITCTYNSEKYLETNIKSLESQTCQDFEHIFIDGFSTDKTIEIIKRYQKRYPDKVKLFQFEPKGISNAMNKGIEKSNGIYINLLHSDDSFYDESVLKDVGDFVDKYNPEVVYGKTKAHNLDNDKYLIWPSRKIYETIKFWKLLFMNYIPHQSAFVKKEVFEKYGCFDENLKSIMDYELWLNFSKNNVDFKFFDRIISNFTIRKDSQSTVDKFNTEQVQIHKKYLNNYIFVWFFFLLDRINRIWVYKIRKSTRI
jgi:glycosyltransferase involved in cell wall biosynthesis